MEEQPAEKKEQERAAHRRGLSLRWLRQSSRLPPCKQDVRVGDLGSGSDYTAFLQHLGVPSADIGSHGPYGVYHSAFDNFAWFTKFGDPTFVYEQQMARVYGLEVIRIASADVLPFNYQDYGKEIGDVLEGCRAESKESFRRTGAVVRRSFECGGALGESWRGCVAIAEQAARRSGGMNLILRNTERAFLIDGLPDRPWFKTCDLCAGRIHRICGGGHSRSE